MCVIVQLSSCSAVCHDVAGCILPGAGAFEIAAHHELIMFKNQVKGRASLGTE